MPFTTEHSQDIADNNFAANTKLINQQIYRENDDPLNFTICRNSGSNITSQQLSRNKALHHVQYPNGDSEVRKKMLTQSDDKYNSHKRGSSKILGSEMIKSPNASPQFEPLKQ